ncbi:MAG: FimB/Mfa2 family fimbrial subunit [Tannerellaceae bacterium]|jgi:hypothetical protein|nr:FimB/Mfa2 family fimbrial subunit [Tannerellaceae bacterium]
MKRNILNVTLSFALLLVATISCVNDDLSECYTDNVRLDFYLYPHTRTLFMQQISSVDVFVFNSDSLFITRKRVEKQEMQKSGLMGTYLSLVPGQYLVACWANVGVSSEVSPLTACETILNRSFVSMNAVPGDSLYYAPARRHANSGNGTTRATGADTLYSITADFGDYTVKDVEFIRAYRTLTVYIKGLPTEAVDDSPLVEVSELSTYYDFSYRTLNSGKKDFTRSSQTADIASETLWVSHFCTVFEPITNNILVNVKQEKEPIASVKLLDYVREYYPSDSNLDDIEIWIEFDPHDKTNVIVKLPPWYVEPVDPAFP